MEFFLKIKSSFNAVLKYETNKINLSEDNFITLKLNLLEPFMLRDNVYGIRNEDGVVLEPLNEI